MSIKESEVLERIGAAIDEMDMDDLAELHNYATNYEVLTGDDIERMERWHLVPLEGAQ